MSRIEDLQESVRNAVSNVDDIAEGLKTAKEDLGAIALELEEAAENADEPTSSIDPEPARVGDIVEILESTRSATVHVGQRATVVSVRPSSPRFPITVLLPQKFGSNSWQMSSEPGEGNQPHWFLAKGTFRVVARFNWDGHVRSYTYPEVS